jgi:hypothetical protein
LKKNEFDEKEETPWSLIFKNGKGVKCIYQALIKKESIPTGISKWIKHELNIENWKDLFKSLYNTTKDSRLIWMQYRILHNILTTNRSFSKFKPEQSDLCEFCNEQSEYISHILFECKISNKFWKEFFLLVNTRCEQAQNLKSTKE